MSELNFELDFSLKRYIVENKDLIRNVTSNKIKEELDKLFKSNNVTKFLDFIKLYNIDNTLGICFNKFVETGTIIGAWSQFELTREYPFTKKEKQNIKVLKCLIKQGKITKMDVYKNGQYLSQIAAKILGIDENKINLMYTCLPIKSIIDIDIESDKISEILNLEKGKKIGEILNILESEIIEGTLKNNRVEIIKRLKEIR